MGTCLKMVNMLICYYNYKVFKLIYLEFFLKLLICFESN